MTWRGWHTGMSRDTGRHRAASKTHMMMVMWWWWFGDTYAWHNVTWWLFSSQTVLDSHFPKNLYLYLMLGWRPQYSNNNNNNKTWSTHKNWAVNMSRKICEYLSISSKWFVGNTHLIQAPSSLNKRNNKFHKSLFFQNWFVENTSLVITPWSS